MCLKSCQRQYDVGDIKKRHGVNIKMEIYSWAVNTLYYPKNCFKIQKKLQFWEFKRVCLGQKNNNTILEEKQFRVSIIYLKQTSLQKILRRKSFCQIFLHLFCIFQFTNLYGIRFVKNFFCLISISRIQFQSGF